MLWPSGELKGTFMDHALSLKIPREKKCPADTINDFELYDGP